MQKGKNRKKRKKGQSEITRRKKNEKREKYADDEGDDSEEDQKDTEAEKYAEKEKEKKWENMEKGKKELMEVGVPKIAQMKTEIAQGRSRPSRGQRRGEFTEGTRQDWALGRSRPGPTAKHLSAIQLSGRARAACLIKYIVL